MPWRSVGRVLVLITNVSIQPTAALQSPTSATGIYENWDADLWDFGTRSEYPVLRVDFDRDGSTEDDIEKQRQT